VTVPPGHWWRTVFFLIPAISVYTILLGIASLVSSLVDRRGHFAHRCAQLWSRWILGTTGVQLRLHGSLPPEVSGSCVFVANHQSIYDIPVVFAALPTQLRILAKASLGRIPFLGWHLHRSGHVLVDRQNPGPSVMRRMEELVREGASLIVFPEGTRSDDGTLGRFKAGAFIIAIDHHLPVVPVTVIGTSVIMRKGYITTRPGLVDVTVHAAMSTAGLKREDVRALIDRVRDVIASPMGVR
jgi:1-acyl-sn-glycerol-3-phosphate acyltransferase